MGSAGRMIKTLSGTVNGLEKWLQRSGFRGTMAYDMIAEYPLEEWHGGLVRHIIKLKSSCLSVDRYLILKDIHSCCKAFT